MTSILLDSGKYIVGRGGRRSSRPGPFLIEAVVEPGVDWDQTPPRWFFIGSYGALLLNQLHKTAPPAGGPIDQTATLCEQLVEQKWGAGFSRQTTEDLVQHYLSRVVWTPFYSGKKGQNLEVFLLPYPTDPLEFVMVLSTVHGLRTGMLKRCTCRRFFVTTPFERLRKRCEVCRGMLITPTAYGLPQSFSRQWQKLQSRLNQQVKRRTRSSEERKQMLAQALDEIWAVRKGGGSLEDWEKRWAEATKTRR
jgi:hypothetical protein